MKLLMHICKAAEQGTTLISCIKIEMDLRSRKHNTITDLMVEPQQHYLVMLLLRRSLCLNMPAFCRKSIAEKLQELMRLGRVEVFK